MTKMTREEKRAADAAAARSARIAEFKKSFARSTGRRIYTDAAAWTAEESGDRSGQALYELVHDFARVKVQLIREVDSCAASMAEMQARIAAGRDAMMWSNGICGRYGADIDKYHAQLETLRKAIAVTAIATGWRVREIEADVETKAFDEQACIDVVGGAGRFWIRKTDAAGVETFFFNGTEFVETALGMSFYTEDDAYAALAVLVTGRTI